ncbi:MAG: hypothetical protein KatS3mg105_2314 [Gemmatales bacterium]|nr:MAG: hypothetical protein KatS3mg105_2314 [Gemmatales bacterium]
MVFRKKAGAKLNKKHGRNDSSGRSEKRAKTAHTRQKSIAGEMVQGRKTGSAQADTAVSFDHDSTFFCHHVLL